MNPQFYLVGGAVRDHILGVPSKDNDYVVVGATPEWMLANGFEQVGSTFPVYLKDGCEYALARQERKTGPGYHGFETKHDPSVTLEDDLLRRDLTINSMAMTENGQIIDPYGGGADLEDGILRHTSEAFADDPLRVLRLARFAARYGFEVHPDTVELAKKIVRSGEIEHLPKERIWMEINKGLTEVNPARMMKVLEQVGAIDGPLSDYFPNGADFADWLDTIFSVMSATGVDVSYEAKFLMCFEAVSQFNEDKIVGELKIPKNLFQMAQHHDILSNLLMDEGLIGPYVALEIITRTRFNATNQTPEMLGILEMMKIEDGFTKYKTAFKSNLDRLELASYALKKVDLRTVAAASDKSNVKQRVEQAKLKAIEDAYTQSECGSAV